MLCEHCIDLRGCRILRHEAADTLPALRIHLHEPSVLLLSSSALASCIALTCSLNSILTVLPPSFLSLIRKVWCIRENVQISARDSKKGHICPVGPDIRVSVDRTQAVSGRTYLTC